MVVDNGNESDDEESARKGEEDTSYLNPFSASKDRKK
jgi:hypothetical protein